MPPLNVTTKTKMGSGASANQQQQQQRAPRPPPPVTNAPPAAAQKPAPPVRWKFYNKYLEFAFNHPEIRSITFPYKLGSKDMAYLALLYEKECKSIPEMYRAMIYKDCMVQELVLNEDIGLTTQIQMIERLSKDIISRSNYRQNLIQSLKSSKKTVIPYRTVNANSTDGIYTFKDLFDLFDLMWYENNSTKITNMKRALEEAADVSVTDEAVKDVYSSLYHIDFGDVMKPPFATHKDEVNTKCRILKDLNVGNSFYIPNDEPVDQVMLNTKVLKHGICSNGSFLFILSENKCITCYKLYHGKILLESSCSYTFNSLDVNDKTMIYCSQSKLFIALEDKSVKYIEIKEIASNPDSLSMTNDGCLCRDRPTTNICSNGITYSITVNNNANVFDCLDDKKLFDDGNLGFEDDIYLSNGRTNSYYVVNTSMEVSTISYYVTSDRDVRFSKKQSDKIFNLITYDCLCECFYAGQYIDNKTKIKVIPYSGPPDLHLFDIKNCDPTKTNFSYKLRTEMTTLLFSSNVPDSLIFDTNVEINFRKLFNFLVLFKSNSNIFMSLLVLLDINLHHCQDIYYSAEILNFLIRLLENKGYKKISLGIILHNAEQLLKPMDEGKAELLIRLIKIGSTTFTLHEWSIMQLLKSSCLAELNVNENSQFYNILNRLFESPNNISELNNENKCLFDLCIVHQESLVDTLNEMIKDDPFNYIDDKIKETLVFQNFIGYTRFIVDKFIHLQAPIKDKLAFKLLENYMNVILSIVHFAAISSTMAEESHTILQYLMTIEENLDEFEQIMYMVYTYSTANLIKGGVLHQYEEKYDWIFMENQNNHHELSIINSIEEYLEKYNDSPYKQFFDDGSTIINKIYSSNNRSRQFNAYKNIFKIFLISLCYQTGTFDDLLALGEEGSVIPPFLKTITSQCFCIIRDYSKLNQEERAKPDIVKKTIIFINNAFALIQLHPSFPAYKALPQEEQEESVKNLASFISENNLETFNKVFTSEEKRLEIIIKGFRLLNDHLTLNQNQNFLKFVISGLSTIIDSFHALSKTLQFNQLSVEQRGIISYFFDHISEFIYSPTPQLSFLSICYGLLEACPSLRATSMNFQNFLLQLISQYLFNMDEIPDSILNTACGLLATDTYIPENICLFQNNVLYFQIYLFLLNRCECPEAVFMHFMDTLINTENPDIQYFLDRKMSLFFLKAINSGAIRSDTRDLALGKVFFYIYAFLKPNLNLFSTYSMYIYAFRKVLNQDDEDSQNLLIKLLNLSIDQDDAKIFIITSILGASVEDNGQYSVISTADGNYAMSYSNNDKIVKVKLPITPDSEFLPYDYNTSSYAIPSVELNYEKVQVNNFVLAFEERCLSVPHSILSRNYLQFLYNFLFNKENADFIPDSIINKLSSVCVPYLDYNFLVSTYDSILMSEKQEHFLQREFSCEVVERQNHRYFIAPKVLSYNQTYLMRVVNDGIHFIFIGKNYVLDMLNCIMLPDNEAFVSDDMIIEFFIDSNSKTIGVKDFVFNCSDDTDIIIVTTCNSEVQIHYDPSCPFHDVVPYLPSLNIEEEYSA